MYIKDVTGAGTLALGTIVGGIGWFLGGYDGILLGVIIFMVVDVITGYMSAVYNKDLSSRKGFWGIVKKLCYFMVIGMVSIIDTQIFNFHGAFRFVFLVWLLGNDGVSIVENLAKMKVKLPDKLLAVLAIMQKKIEDIKIPEIEIKTEEKEDEDSKS